MKIEFYQISLKSMKWEPITGVIQGSMPFARQWPGFLQVSNDMLIIFGGFTENGWLWIIMILIF